MVTRGPGSSSTHWPQLRARSAREKKAREGKLSFQSELWCVSAEPIRKGHIKSLSSPNSGPGEEASLALLPCRDKSSKTERGEELGFWDLKPVSKEKLQVLETHEMFTPVPGIETKARQTYP